MVIIVSFFPSIYFSSYLVTKNTSNSNSDNEINRASNAEDNFSVFRDITASASQQFYLEDGTRNSLTEVTSVNRLSIRSNANLLKNLGIIICNKVFLFSALALATLFFIITAVQYWGSDYMAQVFNVEDTNMILISFSVVCVTSPTFGVILGGWTISMIGGYESKHSILLCLIYAIFAGIFSLPVTYADSLLGFTIYLWLVLFFGGAIVPAITGIIISTVPLHLRGLANSFTSFLSNLFGYLPAPFVYGLLNNIFEKTNNRLAFFCVMNYSFLGVFFLLLACYFRYKNFSKHDAELKKSSNKNLIDEKRNIANKMSHKGSVISDNLQKIFGSYVNLGDEENSDDNIEEEDKSQDNDDSKHYIEKNNINHNETIMTLDIQTTKKKSSENNLTIYNKINNMSQSEQTAQFNISSSHKDEGVWSEQTLHKTEDAAFSFKNKIEDNQLGENHRSGKNSLKRDKFSSDSESCSEYDRDSERNSVRGDVEQNQILSPKDKFTEEAKNVVDDEILDKKERNGYYL